jgi:hypothetical protein
MPRDIWLDDDEPGCLSCGELDYRHSRLAGVCFFCYTSKGRDEDPDGFKEDGTFRRP